MRGVSVDRSRFRLTGRLTGRVSSTADRSENPWTRSLPTSMADANQTGASPNATPVAVAAPVPRRGWSGREVERVGSAKRWGANTVAGVYVHGAGGVGKTALLPRPSRRRCTKRSSRSPGSTAATRPGSRRARGCPGRRPVPIRSRCRHRQLRTRRVLGGYLPAPSSPRCPVVRRADRLAPRSGARVAPREQAGGFTAIGLRPSIRRTPLELRQTARVTGKAAEEAGRWARAIRSPSSSAPTRRRRLGRSPGQPERDRAELGQECSRDWSKPASRPSLATLAVAADRPGDDADLLAAALTGADPPPRGEKACADAATPTRRGGSAPVSARQAGRASSPGDRRDRQRRQVRPWRRLRPVARTAPGRARPDRAPAARRGGEPPRRVAPSSRASGLPVPSDRFLGGSPVTPSRPETAPASPPNRAAAGRSPVNPPALLARRPLGPGARREPIAPPHHGQRGDEGAAQVAAKRLDVFEAGRCDQRLRIRNGPRPGHPRARRDRAMSRPSSQVSEKSASWTAVSDGLAQQRRLADPAGAVHVDAGDPYAPQRFADPTQLHLAAGPAAAPDSAGQPRPASRSGEAPAG